MAQYISVRASSWDLDGLVSQLNEKAAEGWTVVSVVNTGSDIAAVLVSDQAAAAPSPAPAPEQQPETTPVGLGTAVATVSEPAGWAVADTGTSTTASSYEPVTTPAAVAAPIDTGSSYGSTYGTATPVDATSSAYSAQAAQPAASTTPAGWYPDPSGRFELRYWDGGAWTEHVSRQGQQFTDPPVA